MKIIDCFVFYNELEMLKYRLAVLNDYVDYFVLVEANQTYVGHPKPLFFNENRHLFEKYKDKLIHIVIDLPFVYPNIDYKNNKPFQIYDFHENGNQWINEAFQREGILQAFNRLPIEPNDYIIVSDLDEIVNREVLNNIKTNNISFEFYKIEMDLYHYNLNNKLDTKWYHPYIMSYDYYLKIINNYNDPSVTHLTLTEFRLLFLNIDFITNGGWHMSYFGDAKFIKNKRLNYAHVEVQNETTLDINNIQNEINTSMNILTQDNNNLPPLYEEYLQKFII